MTPAYYAVTLADHGVRVEVTGTARAGILRFTFLRGGEASLLVHANRKTQGAIPGGLARVDAARGTIAVSNPVQRIYAGSGRPAGFSGHVVVRVEAPFDAVGTWGGAGVRAGATEQPGEGDVFGGYARFRVRAGQDGHRPRRHVLHVARGRRPEPRGRDRDGRLRRGPRPGRVGLGETPSGGSACGAARATSGRSSTRRSTTPSCSRGSSATRTARTRASGAAGRSSGRSASTTTTTSRSGTPSAPSTRCSSSSSRSACRTSCARCSPRPTRAASCRTSPAGTATRAR